MKRIIAVALSVLMAVSVFGCSSKSSNEIVIMLLEVLLQPEGYLTQSVASGEEALASIAVRTPDLILLDIMRDFLIVLIWLAAFAAKGFVWRGNTMQPPSMQNAE